MSGGFWAVVRGEALRGCADDSPVLEALESRVLLSASYPDMASVAQPADDPALPAEFDVFTPPTESLAVSADAPAFAEWTRTAGPGESLVVSVDNMTTAGLASPGQDTRFVAYGQTAAGGGVVTDVVIDAVDTYTAALTLDDGLASWGTYLLWGENSEGYGYPVAVNRTEAWWVGPDTASPGDVVSIYGRNLAHDNGTTDSWVYVRPVGAGGGQWAVVTAVNPFKVDFVVPAGLADGQYEIWVHNGHGGEYGWSDPLALTVQAAVGWTGPTFDVTDYGAVGDGVTDDYEAIHDALVAAAAVPRSTVYFPAGTYITNYGFNPPANVRWLGEGKDATTIALGPGFVTPETYDGRRYCLIFGGGSNIELSSLTLDANGNLNGYLGTLVYDRFNDNVVYDNVRILAQGYGVADFHGLSHLVLQDVDLIGKQTFLGSASQVFIDGCNFYGTDGAGELLTSWGGHDISVTHSTAQDLDSNPDTPETWCEGRWFVSQGHWGGESNVYFGDNETIDMTCHPDDWNQNSGEQILFELGSNQYTGSPSSATATTVSFADIDDSAYNSGGNQLLVITGGAGVGQYRAISSYDAGTNTFTLEAPWNVVPGSDSIVALVITADRVTLYNNTLDGKERAYQSETHVASSGFQPYFGGMDYVVDHNTFHELRSGMSLWAGSWNDPSATVPLLFGMYSNNTMELNRWAVNIVGGASDLGVTFLGNVFRNNTLVDIVIAGMTWSSATASNPGAWVSMNVVELTSATNLPIGVSFTTPQLYGVGNLVYRQNDFSLGSAAYSGSRGIYLTGLEGVRLIENLWTGFQTTYAGSPAGGLVTTDYRAIAVPTSGSDVQGTLAVRNAGTSLVHWQASSSASWLVLSATDGWLAAEQGQAVSFTCQVVGLSPGLHVATITTSNINNLQVQKQQVWLVVPPASLAVTGVSLNGRADRGVSSVDPGGAGVHVIQVVFSEPATFAAASITLREVTVSGGQETLGQELTGFSVQGSGTDTMTIELPAGQAVDTWVKVVLHAAGVLSAQGVPLDGDAPLLGSGTAYLYDAELDLPSGNGSAGGDAAFYLGSLRGDYDGDRQLTATDVPGFLAAFQAGRADADFRSAGFGGAGPDGLLGACDVDGFSAVWQAGVEAGTSLGDLPILPTGAVTVFEGDLFRIEVSYEQFVGAEEDLVAMTLTMVAKGQGVVNANLFNGAILGLLHQEQYAGLGGNHTISPTDAWWASWELDPGELDSCFLVGQEQLVSVDPPTEDRLSVASDETSPYAVYGFDCGYAESMSGSFALGGYMGATWTFARLVAPVGSEIVLDFEAGGIQGAEQVDTTFLVAGAAL